MLLNELHSAFGFSFVGLRAMFLGPVIEVFLCGFRRRVRQFDGLTATIS